MKTGFIVAGLLAVLSMPVAADAQGIVGGAQQGSSQGAKEGSKVLGPVGGAVGGVVGGATGAAVGGVKGALGVPASKPKKKKADPVNRQIDRGNFDASAATARRDDLYGLRVGRRTAARAFSVARVSRLNSQRDSCVIPLFTAG